MHKTSELLLTTAEVDMLFHLSLEDTNNLTGWGGCSRDLALNRLCSDFQAFHLLSQMMKQLLHVIMNEATKYAFKVSWYGLH